MKALAVIPTLILSLLVSTVQAGTLDDLESESTKSKSRSSSSNSSSSPTTYSSNSSSNSSSGNSLTNAVGGLLAEIIVKAIGLGITTMAHAGENSLFRAKGDPILPTVRISSQWLYGNDDINAQLYRAEIGYGFFGVSFSQNDLQESGDTLSVSNTLLHYRMSFGNDFSWDLAFGRGKMNGNQKHDGSVFAMPMRYRYNRDWHFEYYPVWSSYEGGSLAEHQFSFNYHYQHIGATLGYKTWSSGATAVDGLFTGLYLSF
jgi:hypothetical protein